MDHSFGSGSPRSGQRARLRLAAAAVALALPAALLLRGFTVDDALISARVAAHLASGAGYRFNPEGPVVDAVTPLGWAHLLALFGPGTPLQMLERGRAVGLLCWLLATASLGALLATAPARGRRGALLLLALSSPAAAWAASGMETGLVTLLATLALVPGLGGALLGGLSAALRPELVPWAAVLAVGGALSVAAAPRRRALKVSLALAAALGPALAVALVRTFWFGSPAPLSLLAKPPDLGPGIRYALAVLLLSGPPLVLLSPRGLYKSSPEAIRLAVALLAHLGSLALAGGD